MRTLAPLALLAVASGLSLNGCAPTPDGGVGVDRQSRAALPCFDTSRVTNFRSDRDTTLYIRANNRDVYELQTSGACWDLDTTIGIALRPSRGGIDRLCIGDWADVTVVGSSAPAPRPCRAHVVRSLTEAEVEALPSRVRP